MNSLYPAFLKLQDRPCLVVGGGEIAYHKSLSLLNCGARVTMIAPRCKEEILVLAEESDRFQYKKRVFQTDDLDGAWLIVASTDSDEVNRAVYEESCKRHLWCNVVDQPELCDFYVPSIVQQGNLKVAVSTNGKSPALAGGIRRMLERVFGDEFADILELAGELRAKVRENIPDDGKKRMATLKQMTQADELLHALSHHKDKDRDAILDSWKSYLSD